ncbi:MAG: hypothetical protein ACM37W_15825 [Actinomycetota bacterium]
MKIQRLNSFTLVASVHAIASPLPNSPNFRKRRRAIASQWEHPIFK